jgi:hypothetical protein
MTLTAIEPSDTGHDLGHGLRTFTCPECRRVQRHVIESTVTAAWPDQKRGKAVTHEIRDGRLMPKRVT